MPQKLLSALCLLYIFLNLYSGGTCNILFSNFNFNFKISITVEIQFYWIGPYSAQNGRDNAGGVGQITKSQNRI